MDTIPTPPQPGELCPPNGYSRRPLVLLVGPGQQLPRSLLEAVLHDRFFIARQITLPDTATPAEVDDAWARVLFVATLLDPHGALCVIGWYKMSDADQHLAAALAKRPALTESASATDNRPDVRLVTVRNRLLLDVKPTPGSVSDAATQTRVEAVQRHLAQMLPPLFKEEFTSAKRTYPNARKWAEDLRLTEADTDAVRRLLTLFGYENPKGNLGRWSHHMKTLLGEEAAE